MIKIQVSVYTHHMNCSIPVVVLLSLTHRYTDFIRVVAAQSYMYLALIHWYYTHTYNPI